MTAEDEFNKQFAGSLLQDPKTAAYLAATGRETPTVDPPEHLVEVFRELRELGREANRAARRGDRWARLFVIALDVAAGLDDRTVILRIARRIR